MVVFIQGPANTEALYFVGITHHNSTPKRIAMQDTICGYKEAYDEKTVSVLDDINIRLNCVMTSGYAFSILAHGLDLVEKQCEDNIKKVKEAVKRYPNLIDILEMEKEALEDVKALSVTMALNASKNRSH